MRVPWLTAALVSVVAWLVPNAGAQGAAGMASVNEIHETRLLQVEKEQIRRVEIGEALASVQKEAPTAEKEPKSEKEQPKAGSQPGAVTNGLVARFEANGNAEDSSGSGNHGTWKLTPAAYTNDRSNVPSSAFLFNGVTGYICIPDSPSLETDYEFTLAAWVNPKTYGDSLGTSEAILAKWWSSARAGDYLLRTDSTGRLLFTVAHNDPGAIVMDSVGSGPVVPTNAWTHVAAAFNRGAMKIYVNGRLATNKVSTTVLHTNLGDYDYDEVTIGGHSPDNAYHFNGAIDEVRIYNRALSQAEVVGLFLSSDHPTLSEEDEKEIVDLVRQLGANDPKLRKEGARKLTAIGRKALLVLIRYENDNDPEIRANVQKLLRP